MKDNFKLMKNDCSLFARLYIACQNFFKHENLMCQTPLATTSPNTDTMDVEAAVHEDISKVGFFYDTSAEVDPRHTEDQIDAAPVLKVDAKVLDGAAIVEMLSPKLTKMFVEYVGNILLPYISRNLQTFCRVDMVFDVYIHDSLKARKRDNRGYGVQNGTAICTATR